jgi:hypothetical protein
MPDKSGNYEFFYQNIELPRVIDNIFMMMVYESFVAIEGGLFLYPPWAGELLPAQG